MTSPRPATGAAPASPTGGLLQRMWRTSPPLTAVGAFMLVAAALRHALAFSTWRSLSESGVRRRDAVTLMTAFVAAA